MLGNHFERKCKIFKKISCNVICKLLNHKLSLTGNSHKGDWYKQEVAKEICGGY